MTVLIYLIPVALLLGLAALFGFLWALKSGQYDDLDGEASRILFEEDAPDVLDAIRKETEDSKDKTGP